MVHHAIIDPGFSIDLDRRMVRAACAVPRLERPVGLAVRGSQLMVAQADGRVAVLERPVP